MQRREFAKLALAGAVGTVAASTVVKAETTKMTVANRIVLDDCCGILVDVQDYFLGQLDRSRRPKIRTNISNFARLLGYFRIPVVVTLEGPVDLNGSLTEEIKENVSNLAETFEKQSFDLTKEKQIRDHLARLKKKQVIVAGCETDVCVLQSCLGLRRLGYQVYVVEDLLFSSSRNVDAALARMKAEGAIFLTYKSLYHELSVYELSDGTEDGREKLRATLGPFPRDLPESAD